MELGGHQRIELAEQGRGSPVRLRLDDPGVRQVCGRQFLGDRQERPSVIEDPDGLDVFAMPDGTSDGFDDVTKVLVLRRLQVQSKTTHAVTTRAHQFRRTRPRILRQVRTLHPEHEVRCDLDVVRRDAGAQEDLTALVVADADGAGTGAQSANATGSAARQMRTGAGPDHDVRNPECLPDVRRDGVLEQATQCPRVVPVRQIAAAPEHTDGGAETLTKTAPGLDMQVRDRRVVHPRARRTNAVSALDVVMHEINEEEIPEVRRVVTALNDGSLHDSDGPSPRPPAPASSRGRSESKLG